MSKEPISKLVTNDRSNTIDGLSGRLRIELEDINPGLRCAVYLEIKNHSKMPVAITNQPVIQAELYNQSGIPVDDSGFPGSGPIQDAQWAVIPGEAYIGFRIDMQTVGVPTPDRKMVLLAIGGKAWGLSIGVYTLKVGLTSTSKIEAPENQWTGKMALPSVEIWITAEMLQSQIN